MIIEVRRKTHIQRMTYEDFEQRIRAGEITANTQVRFELVTGDEFRPAGDLELFQELADPQRMEFRNRLTRPIVPLMTAILVGVQIRLYLWSWAPGAEVWLQEGFTNWPPAILEQGEAWRLFSYGLLHVSFTHLLFNLTFLVYAGYHLERAMGRANLLLLFVGSVFTGGLLSMLMTPDQASLGASGGDFGLLAAGVVLGWKHWDSIPERARRYYGWALVPYPIVSLLTGINAPNVDNWSHLGGLMGGMALITVLDPEVLPGRRKANRRIRTIAVSALMLVAVGIGVQGVRLMPLETHSADSWEVGRPGYWREGWTITGNRGWYSRTMNATFSAVETTYHRPVTTEDAADNLIGRIGRGPREPEVVVRETLDISGLEAIRLVLRFDISGEQRQAEALVLTRGVYEYRLVFISTLEMADRYAPLVQRIEDSLVIGEVAELAKKRTRSATHPRSWGPACDLGEALYRAGEAGEALRTFERALEIDPANPRALIGMLEVYAYYDVEGGLDVARRALVDAPEDAGVVVAAAEVMAGEGARDEAVAALDAAWAVLPGDVDLRKTRLLWGLSVELPGVLPTGDQPG